jgi:hypothetical protein
VTKTRLIRAAGLRWPVEECFEFGKCQAPGLMEMGLSGVQGCVDRVGHCV